MTTQILKSGVERIEIGGAWYDLRRAVGWYQLEATSELAAIKMTLPVRIANRMSNLDDLDPDTPVGLEIRQHERTLARLSDRIAGWSYDQPINEGNIKRLPPAHVGQLVAEIETLEDAERGALEELADGAPFG
jgi:hypothetical protein